ncbi:hypothetical protein ACFW2V_13860 [Streptomyces sp. NPDC058947]|uniref:hypothetical protein n=1 Tax=Streptomyces sp. NPDC058947 TaxID=3346675 RepID=UPI0036C62412
MELIQSHRTPGPGPIRIEAPELPVSITVQPGAEYRQVHILADRGLGAHAGPGGPRGREMRIFVGRPSLMASLFGLRRRSTISGGSVVAAGRGSIVSGGDISFSANGNGSRVTIDGAPVRQRGIGVHLTVPLGCTFDIRGYDGLTVHYRDNEMTFEAAAGIGILERV